MDPFPEDITIDILSRLPVKSFLQCRSICRFMRNFGHDPIFVEKHLSLSSQRNPNLILIDTICRDIGNDHNKLYFVENKESLDRYTCHKVNFEIPDFQEFRIMGSCNALLCLVHPRNRYKMYICNPCTGKYVQIPPPVRMADRPCDIVVGFGISPITHKYKVVAIIDFPETSMFNLLQQKVVVYTLGDASWRFKDNESVLNVAQSVSKAFVNGVLHWVSNCAGKLIVSFNITNELFGVIPRPQLQLGRGSFSLRVLEGQLSILNTSFDDRIEIWVMNDYGIVESWNHIFTIYHHQVGRNIRDIEIVCFLEDWEVLLVYDHRALFRYNLQSAKASELNIGGLPKRFDAVAHVGSLVLP